MKRRARRRLGAVLMLGCLLLGLATAAPWLGIAGSQTPAPAVSGSAAPEARPIVDLAALSPAGLDGFPQTRDRPLFLSTRRVIAATTGNAAAAAGIIMDRYVFTGVVISPDKRLVLLRPVGGGGVMRVAEGDVLDGWLIEEIANDFLTIVADGRREVVPLLGQAPETRR